MCPRARRCRSAPLNCRSVQAGGLGAVGGCGGRVFPAGSSACAGWGLGARVASSRQRAFVPRAGGGSRLRRQPACAAPREVQAGPSVEAGTRAAHQRRATAALSGAGRRQVGGSCPAGARCGRGDARAACCDSPHDVQAMHSALHFATDTLAHIPLVSWQLGCVRLQFCD